MMSTSVRQRVQAVAEDQSVTALELFFDLVFVYALTQVTALMSLNLTGRGVLQGMIVLALIWWCWTGYSWLGNAIKADEGWSRAAFIGVMATMFIAALTIPESFDDLPGGLNGPLTLTVCYAIVRAVHLGIFVVAARTSADAGLMRQLVKFGVIPVISLTLMIVGALAGGDAQLGLWLAAIVVDYMGTQVIGAEGWRLTAPGHFSERHGLIIIIALGESIVAIGVGATAFPISTPLIIASVLGILLVSTMWWIYFDVTALAAERRLAQTEGVERALMARDAYSYGHLPMIAGVVFAALGLKKVLGYVGGEGHDWSDSLHGLAAWSLHIGPALYLVALILVRVRVVRSLSRSRSVGALALLATTPLASHVGVLVDLVLVTGTMAALITWESVKYAESRHRIRHLEGHHPAEHPGPVPPA
jgi:low temperature requirement protein LtrA